MPIRVPCPSCRRSLRVPERLIGQPVKCPACFERFTASQQDAAAEYSDYRLAREEPPRPPKPEPSDANDDGYDREDRDEWDGNYRRPKRRRRRVDRESASARLFGPAIGLLSTAILGILFGLLCLLVGPLMLGDATNADERIDAIWTLFYGLIHLIASLVAITGAIAMLRLRIHKLALAGSILALIPAISPCCLLGVPFGVWGIVVLNDNKVKRAFD
jgi:hypothetical protein